MKIGLQMQFSKNSLRHDISTNVHAFPKRYSMKTKADPTAEISDAWRRFLRLFALNDTEGVAACYTEDAQMLVAHMKPIQGRAAIEAVLKFTGGQGHTLEFQTAELDVHGTTAVELGRYIRRQSDGTTADHGKYIVVWKRIGEEWRIHRDMFNTNQPKVSTGFRI
jgi:ketosteroid isomerase-like protein